MGNCQRSLLARSISDPSVLATRGTYVFIFSFFCVLCVCNVFTTPRAGHQSRPLPLVGQLPRVSTEDRVVSVFETLACLILGCLQIFSFFPLSSSSFYTVQYRRVQYSTVIGQLPRVSRED